MRAGRGQRYTPVLKAVRVEGRRGSNQRFCKMSLRFAMLFVLSPNVSRHTYTHTADEVVQLHLDHLKIKKKGRDFNLQGVRVI